MHACSANSLFPDKVQPQQRSHHVDPTLDSAPGTHHCWVDRDNADFYMIGATRIKPQTHGSGVKQLNCSAMHSIIMHGFAEGPQSQSTSIHV